MSKKLNILLTAGALCAVCLPANAANKEGKFSISPFIGGYTFDGDQQLKTRPVFGIRGGYNFTDTIGAELVYDYVHSASTKTDNKADVQNYRLEALYHFFPESRLVPYIAAGYGGITVKEEGQESQTRGAFGYGAGLKYFLTEDWALRGDLRHFIMSKGDTNYNYEYTVGLGYFFGAAPPAPKPAEPAPAPVAAPAPAPRVAAKPSANLSASPSSIVKGNPATLTWSSQNAAICEIQPGIGAVPVQGTITVTPDSSTPYSITCTGEGGSASSSANVAVAMPQSKPVAPALPTSKITVTPETITAGQGAVLNWSSQNASSCDIQPGIGPVETLGSRPVNPSVDTNYAITCTGAGGTANSQTALRVTPKPVEKPAVKSEKRCITLKLEFDTDKADIKSKYHDEIKKVGDFLNQYPTATGVIEGHTDNQASAGYNLKLSQKRADAVRQYLVDKFGIAPDRLSAKGYGLSKPVADNKTAAGRALNRRIEANIDCVVNVPQ